MQSEAARGVGAMVAACCIWGLSPLYYKLLAEVPAAEVLSHRMIWSLVFFGAVLAVQRRLREVIGAMNTGSALLRVVLASLMIGANWGLFIWSVQTGQTTQTSLGYYIYPLVAVVIGRIVFAERLSPVQWLAVALATLAVTLLTLGLGLLPWIALTLAGTFSIYGLLKKQMAAGPVVSVTAEVLLLVPLALMILLQSHHNGGTVLGGDWRIFALLVFSGPMTALPLILFSYAARRLAMTTVGLLQYLNPTLQFGCAVFVFAEPFGPWHVAAFALIWTALALYSGAALRQDRARRRAARAAAVSGTAV
ncbi:EamA family transporter RarD [Roseobacter sinensis]|uniref:EamA family transporter RarD n=1 Tax=Roseobacter sinensis TaxID=2931391 RepID=A0ABT3BG74_9RHOB|nr:EamA family transporter RarD [Roseobacter sp. WL0113]MCV3272587.1 EamA family transporter RarD [Roseobacter sp. WL0113]